MLSLDLLHELSVLKQNDLPQWRACARSVGITSQGHLVFILEVLEKSSKADDATGKHPPQ